MTSSDRANLRALAEAATPGRWNHSYSRVIEAKTPGKWVRVINDDPKDPEGAGVVRAADAEFITAANPATVLDLLDENAELQARIDAALACYGQTPGLSLGESRWRSADEFLIAIRAALSVRPTPEKEN